MSILEKIKEAVSARSEEKQVQNILEKKLIAIGWFEKNEIKVVRIEPNLFSVGTEKNISFYCDIKGKISFNIGYIREQPFFESFLSTAGVYEIKNKNGEYELFRVNHDSLSPEKKAKGEKDISLYSKEYFSIWEDVNFYRNKFTVRFFQRQDRDKNYHPLSDAKIQRLFDAKSLRVRDFVFFLEHKQISQEAYNTHMQKLIERLPNQIGDLRLNKIDDIVTTWEIRDYLKRKMITQEMFDILNRSIKSRNELLGIKDLADDEIRKKTSSQLNALKQR